MHGGAHGRDVDVGGIHERSAVAVVGAVRQRKVPPCHPHSRGRCGGHGSARGRGGGHVHHQRAGWQRVLNRLEHRADPCLLPGEERHRSPGEGRHRSRCICRVWVPCWCCVCCWGGCCCMCAARCAPCLLFLADAYCSPTACEPGTGVLCGLHVRLVECVANREVTRQKATLSLPSPAGRTTRSSPTPRTPMIPSLG